jgi:phenylacetate-CoA ligase
MYEPLFRHLLFPAYETLVRRRDTRRHIAEYERSQWLDRDALEALQLRKLNALLEHCWQHVPFLQLHWQAHGVQRGPLSRLADLASYPTLTKAQITAHYDDMIARPWRGRTLSKVTGGSTGTPFRFEYTMDVYARRTAVMWRGYGWGGARLGTRTAYLWGTGLRKGGWGGLKDRLYHGAFNRRFFDAFSLTESNIDQRIDEITAYRPHAAVGYVAPLVLVARRMLQTGRRLTGLRGVLTGAEALYDNERRDIGQAFGCPVFNTYGSREVMLMASECEQHGLHVNADHLILETLGADGRPTRTSSGEIALTDLHNFGMPMVRYLNGDRATYAAQSCPCGRGLPLLASVDGRVLDLIETPDGRHVPGEFCVYVMLDWPEVKQWQVVQTEPDCMQFRLVVATPWTEAQRAKLIAKVQSVAGAGMRVEVVEVDAIPVGPSGKRRLTVSLARAATAG